MSRLQLLAVVTAVTASVGCGPGQPKVTTGANVIPLGECLRTTMAASGLRVMEGPTEEGARRKLVGHSGETVGPVDSLTVWFDASAFTMSGKTSQAMNARNAFGEMQYGVRELPKSTRLRSLEEKLTTQCKVAEGDLDLRTRGRRAHW